MALNAISNFAASVAARNLAQSDEAATRSLAKLSIGSRVVSAKDDAASLAIGSRLAAEVVGLKQAAVNAGQAISMLQIADGAMAKINNVLLRMKSLSVQAGSGQLSATDRSTLNREFEDLRQEVDRNAKDTDFAGQLLTSGSIAVDRASATAFATSTGVQNIVFRGDHSTASNATIAYDNTNGAFSVTIVAGTATNIFTGTIATGTNDGTNMTTGAIVTLTNTNSSNKVDIALNTAFVFNGAKASGTLGLSGTNVTTFNFKVGTGASSTADELQVSINSVDVSALSIGNTVISSQADADAASVAVSNAIDDLQTYRANLGANQNRLEFAAANLGIAIENSEAARSQLLDLDIASEMSTFVSNQILIQAGVSMLAQANEMPNNLLRLFQ